LRLFWTHRGRADRIALIAIALVTAVAVGLFLKFGSATTYATAYAGMDPRDSAAAVAILKAQQIPYQVSADGGTLKVPADRLGDARLKLAAKGLPQGGGSGFELFDTTSFGQTDFVQNVTY